MIEQNTGKEIQRGAKNPATTREDSKDPRHAKKGKELTTIMQTRTAENKEA